MEFQVNVLLQLLVHLIKPEHALSKLPLEFYLKHFFLFYFLYQIKLQNNLNKLKQLSILKVLNNSNNYLIYNHLMEKVILDDIMSKQRWTELLLKLISDLF